MKHYYESAFKVITIQPILATGVEKIADHSIIGLRKFSKMAEIV